MMPFLEYGVVSSKRSLLQCATAPAGLSIIPIGDVQQALFGERICLLGQIADALRLLPGRTPDP